MLVLMQHDIFFLAKRKDNCLTDQKVNDYKQFPRSFVHFVKTRLGIESKTPEVSAQEELEFRYNTVKTYIDRFLSNHDLP
ncbi:MAG: hypothetical protein EBS29_12260, partial [Chloroflexia bacterium]|nr:hypothetical protein [Chloroflexia bacterium]